MGGTSVQSRSLNHEVSTRPTLPRRGDAPWRPKLRHRRGVADRGPHRREESLREAAGAAGSSRCRSHAPQASSASLAATRRVRSRYPEPSPRGERRAAGIRESLGGSQATCVYGPGRYSSARARHQRCRIRLRQRYLTRSRRRCRTGYQPGYDPCNTRINDWFLELNFDGGRHVGTKEVFDQPTPSSKERYAPDLQLCSGSQSSRCAEGIPQGRAEGISQSGTKGVAQSCAAGVPQSCAEGGMFRSLTVTGAYPQGRSTTH